MLQLLNVSITKRAVLKVDLPGKLPAVRANPAQIRQVVMNLITNASEALGEGEGAISLNVTSIQSDRGTRQNDSLKLAGGEHIRLEVSDTGCRMTNEIQAKIFDPFFTTKFAARGLGLAAVQGIIRDHGGTINVVSAPGLGSRFEILLPCTDQPAPVTRDVGLSTSSQVGSVSGTVLLVEDEEILRLAVSKALRRRGFYAIEATDGRAGVDLFQAHESEIDAVVLDMTLPTMSGHEVLVELRQIRPDVKVILTTAYSEDTALLNVGDQRPWRFIRKPYQLAELADLVRSACLAERGMSGNAAG
jgi:two-component system cell cycle sensor histidine kinase/response regulator CckA